MKRIMFLVPSLMMGGMERVLVNYANLFVGRGYDVTVYNLTDDDKAITDNFDSKVKYYKNYTPVKHLLKSDFKSIITGNFRLMSFYKWLTFHSSRYVYKRFFKEHFDVEIAFYGDGSIMILNGCKNKMTKKVAFFHNNNLYDFYSTHPKHFKRILKIIDNFDYKICVSDIVRTDFIKTFGNLDNVISVNNPIETKRIRVLSEDKISINKKRFTFINVSRLDDKSKGFVRLLSVCKKLCEEKMEFDLWIVGDGLDAEMIKKKSEEFGLNNVVFLGKQSNPYKFMSKADMYICSSFHEGFSMSMVESLSLGLPMISTDISGAREMLGDSEYGLIVENSENGIYTGMKKILSDVSLYNHYKQKAKERMDYFSEEKIMDKLETLLFGKN